MPIKQKKLNQSPRLILNKNLEGWKKPKTFFSNNLDFFVKNLAFRATKWSSYVDYYKIQFLRNVSVFNSQNPSDLKQIVCLFKYLMKRIYKQIDET